MKNKTVLLLLGILHICIFSFALFTIPYFKNDTPVVVSSSNINTTVEDSEIPSEPEETSKIPLEMVSETEVLDEEDVSPEESSEAASEYAVPYAFIYNGSSRLNIRNNPSMDGKIIGKVSSGKQGTVINIVDDEWVEVTYGEITGYCYRAYTFPVE